MNEQMNFGSDENEAATISGLPPIQMEPAVVREPPKRKVLANGDVTFPDDRVVISLEHGDEVPPTGLFVQVNGVGYMIKPQMPCPVPLGVIEVLDHAIAAKPVQDPQTLQVIGFQDRLRFPYRVLRHLPAGQPFTFPS